jgi:hypothetical protein
MMKRSTGKWESLLLSSSSHSTRNNKNRSIDVTNHTGETHSQNNETVLLIYETTTTSKNFQLKLELLTHSDHY